MKKYLPWIIGGAVLVAAIFLLWHSKKKRCKCKASAAAAAGSTATTTTSGSSDTGANAGSGSACGNGGANPPVLPAGTFDDGLHGNIPVYNTPIADNVYSGNPIL